MLTNEERHVVLLLVLTGRVEEAREYAAKCEARRKEEVSHNADI